MEKELFDRETMLDLTVNLIPLGILLLFVLIYLVFNPFGFGSVISSIQFAIIGAMFVALAALTYYSGAAVSRAENQMEAAAALEEDETETEALEGDDGEADDGQDPAELTGSDGENDAEAETDDDGDETA